MNFDNPDVDSLEAKSRSKQRFGKKNGRWKGGRSKSYRRRVTRAKPGQVVHHKNKKKSDNRPSNFEKMSPSKHNKKHPEKGRKNRNKKKR